jgi:hypothetical protein
MLESAAMQKARISVTVDRALLNEFRHVAGKDARLSAVVSQALRREINRLGMLALLEEWEREDPISPKNRAAGDRKWRTAVLSFAREPFRHSRKRKTKKSAARSNRR